MTATMNPGASGASNSAAHSNHHAKTLDLTLKVWRQEGPNASGRYETYEAKGISEDSSFLEMLDIVNENLNDDNKQPITFDHDCREGICGTCSLMINGVPHGPERNTATCQLHMRKFTSGQTITVEPWRATAFPIIKDLMVDRSAFDRIIESGGYITVAAGGAPDGNLIPIPKPVADAAMDAAACIGCGACVAVLPRCLPQPRSLTSTCCRRGNRNGSSGPKRWLKPWRATSEVAPIMASAKKRVRRASLSTTSQ
jgi:succinate dehydrogenase/fumarate reductase-like Fe-S protein